MLSASDLERALRAALPPELQSRAGQLAAILADAANGALSNEDARSQIAALPNAAGLISALAGQRIPSNQSVLSFGADSQLGDVNIRDVAGRDVVQLQQTIVYQQPPPGSATPSRQFLRYLEAVESQILASFRQDAYVMLNVTPVAGEDAHTLTPIQEALYSTFQIQVSAGIQSAGKPQPLVEAITGKRLITLLGDPGLGKTTSMRYVGLQQLAAVQAGQNEKLPLWVALGRWDDLTMPAEQFLWREYCNVESAPSLTQEAFEAQLRAGQFLVLLDGLNEMPQRKLIGRGGGSSSTPDDSEATGQHTLDPRENSLLALARESRSSFVLSCRVSDYAHFPGWYEFKVLPFDDAQIDEFVGRYLGPQRTVLDSILVAQPQLRELMRNPYLLRNLVFLAQVKWQSIPQDRFELVEQACLAALHREVPRRGLLVNDVVKELAQWAYGAMEAGYIGSLFVTTYEPDDDDLIIVRCAEGAGLMVSAGTYEGKIAYRYQHQLVQEALALIHVRTKEVAENDNATAWALLKVGEEHHNWGKFKEAQENYQRALELCPTVGAEQLRAAIHLRLSRLYRQWRRSREGITHGEIALQLMGNDENLELAATLIEMGAISERLRQLNDAIAYYTRALSIYETLGRKEQMAYTLINTLGSFYINRKVYQPLKAIQLFERALSLFLELDHKRGVALAKQRLGRAWWMWGELNKAEALYLESIPILENLDLLDLQCTSLIMLGHIRTAKRNHLEATKAYERALQIARKHNLLNSQFAVLVWGLGESALLQGRYQRTLEYFEEARSITKRLADSSYYMKFLHNLGTAHYYAGVYDKAKICYRECASLIDEEFLLDQSPIERLAHWWSKQDGGVWRIIARLGQPLYVAWEKAKYPNNWSGKMLWKLMWWGGKF